MTDVHVQDAPQKREGPPGKRRLRLSLLGSVTGNALEWYDWNAYAVFALYLSSALFDSGDRVSALLSTFAVFAAGFVTRPLGGVVFGAMADRVGRRTVLVVTMLMTAGGSLLVGLTPGYESAGVWSSVILLVARLVQGLGHGGESAAAFAYVAEIAPPARRGLWSSAVFVGVTLGTLLATGLGAFLTAVLPSAALASWGWRVPFLVGGVLGVFALYLRHAAVESGPTAAPERHRGKPAPALRTPLGPALRIIALTASIGVVYYTWIVFGVGNAVDRHGMPEDEAFTAGLLAQLLGLCALPLWGRLSDRYGRRPLAVGYALGSALCAFPLVMIVSSEGWTLFVSELAAMVLWAMMAAVYPALVSELLPSRVRGKGIGIATSLANAAFGGTAPYLGKLFESQNLDWIFTLYLILLCLLGALAAWTMPETRGIDLDDVR